MKNIIFSSIASLAIFCLASCSQSEVTVPESVNIIPQPSQIEVLDGAFSVAGTSVSCSPAFDELSQKAVSDFAQKLSLTTGKKSRFSVKDAAGKGISFSLDSALPEEGYTIEVGQNSVEVTAAGLNGVVYAIQSLSQMLPAEFFGEVAAKDANWALRCCTIVDAPRFGYRGVLLDCCRHFFDVDQVKKFIDLLALHKMNIFHWHLSEDQGWRIEIKKYPKLTEIGSVRHGTMIGKDWSSNDGIEYGGFYTQEEAKDIVSYAASKGITIIPEIDLPGHMMSALASYPELGCTGGPYEVNTKWGVMDQVLCPGKETTFEFLEGVLEEIIEIFPSEYIHIGGDECPKTQWAVCPDCQARIKELGLVSDEIASAETRLQNYVTARVQKFLNDRGRKIIGWTEILDGELAPGATVMSWLGEQGAIKASTNGFDVIMTPSGSGCYLDYYQTDKLDIEPLAIGGNSSLEKLYSYEPYEGVPEDAQHHILGVQGNMWTEFIAKENHLQYMALPRFCALSEVQWCSPEQKDIERLKGDIAHISKIYDAMGCAWCKAIFGEYGLPGVPGGTN